MQNVLSNDTWKPISTWNLDRTREAQCWNSKEIAQRYFSQYGNYGIFTIFDKNFVKAMFY